MKLRPAVFLDRDGVLNRTEVRDGKPYAPRLLEEFEIFPDAAEAVGELKRMGFALIVVTNQPDVGNGFVDRSVVEGMNAKLTAELGIDAVKTCFHGQAENCDCRKPKPGMLVEAAKEFDIDLAASFMIGDRRGDMLAGHAAGCRTIFLDRGYRDNERPKTGEAEFSAPTLAAAVTYIETESNPSKGEDDERT